MPSPTEAENDTGMNGAGVLASLGAVRAEISRAVRGPRFLVLGIVVPLALFVAYTVTGIAGAPDRTIGSLAWSSYFMVSMAAFGAMSAAVGVAAGGFATAPTRARSGGAGATGDLGPGLAVTFVSAVVLALLPLLLLGLAGALEGIRLPALDWLTLVISLWLGALPFVALGLLLRPVLDADTGDVVILAILVVLAILGGYFQPIDTLPASLVVVAQVLPSFHLADLGWMAIAARAVDPVDVLVLAGYTVVIGAIIVWHMRSEEAQVGE